MTEPRPPRSSGTPADASASDGNAGFRPLTPGPGLPGLADLVTGSTGGRTGALFEVTKDTGELVWLAFLDDATERFHVYNHHTRCFHINRWLTLDYEIDTNLQFALITPVQARLIAARDRRRITATVLSEHVADTTAIPAHLVLGSSHAKG